MYWKKEAQDGATRQEAKRRFMDLAREDMQIFGVREEAAEDRERWRRLIHWGHSWKILGKGEEGRRNIHCEEFGCIGNGLHSLSAFFLVHVILDLVNFMI